MRVLVVEDETRMARLLERALREEGHAVDVATDGPEGLWLATENEYGAVVLDVTLPGLDGFQLCRRLRESGRWVPVLMLTARDAVGDRVRGLDAGADDYLVKPFSLLELAARLRALARRDDRSRPVILAEGDLSLDPAAKRAWRDGSELHLSPKEFALLELFLREEDRWSARVEAALTGRGRPGQRLAVFACAEIGLLEVVTLPEARPATGADRGCSASESAPGIGRSPQQGMPSGWAAGHEDRACCCPAHPVVRAIMPATLERPDSVDLLLCGHHYRVSRQALAAARARIENLPGQADAAAAALLETVHRDPAQVR